LIQAVAAPVGTEKKDVAQRLEKKLSCLKAVPLWLDWQISAVVQRRVQPAAGGELEAMAGRREIPLLPAFSPATES